MRTNVNSIQIISINEQVLRKRAELGLKKKCFFGKKCFDKWLEVKSHSVKSCI